MVGEEPPFEASSSSDSEPAIPAVLTPSARTLTPSVSGSSVQRRLALVAEESERRREAGHAADAAAERERAADSQQRHADSLSALARAAAAAAVQPLQEALNNQAVFIQAQATEHSAIAQRSQMQLDTMMAMLRRQNLPPEPSPAPPTPVPASSPPSDLPSLAVRGVPNPGGGVNGGGRSPSGWG